MIHLNEYLINKSTKEKTKVYSKIKDFVEALKKYDITISRCDDELYATYEKSISYGRYIFLGKITGLWGDRLCHKKDKMQFNGRDGRYDIDYIKLTPNPSENNYILPLTEENVLLIKKALDTH